MMLMNTANSQNEHSDRWRCRITASFGVQCGKVCSFTGLHNATTGGRVEMETAESMGIRCGSAARTRVLTQERSEAPEACPASRRS